MRPTGAKALLHVVSDGGPDRDKILDEVSISVLRASAKGVHSYPPGSSKALLAEVKQLLQAFGYEGLIRSKSHLKTWAYETLIDALRNKHNMTIKMIQVVPVLQSNCVPPTWPKRSLADVLGDAFNSEGATDLDEDADDIVQEEAPQDATEPPRTANSLRAGWETYYELYGRHSCSRCYKKIGDGGRHRCSLGGGLSQDLVVCVGQRDLKGGGYGFGYKGRSYNMKGCLGCRPRVLGQDFEPHDTFTPYDEEAWKKSWREGGLKPPELVGTELKQHSCPICYAPILNNGGHRCPGNSGKKVGQCIGSFSIANGGYGWPKGRCAGCRPKVMPDGWRPPYGFEPSEPWNESWDRDDRSPPEPLKMGETLAASSVAPTKEPPLRVFPSHRAENFMPSELNFIAKVREHFAAGKLPQIKDGTFLRQLLARDLLYCEPIRLTHRFKGNDALGRKAFKRTGELNATELSELRRLESAFHASVSGSGPGQLKDVEPYF